MKATINSNGTLCIEAEDGLESYALERWVEQNKNFENMLISWNLDKTKMGGWWCTRCKVYVSAESVTFEEKHDVCGADVIYREEN